SQDHPATFRFGGCHFDFSAPRTSGRLLQALVSDQLYVHDVSATGVADVGPSLSWFDVTDEDGTGLLDRLVLPEGATPDTTGTGSCVGNYHRGVLTYRDCQIAGFADSGLDADPPSGQIVIDGG
ncbi:MAG: hypothetical protein RI568_13015, partial [Natronomonas sp.]|nr:hypothetical protein [Natronomonas sp.]